MCLVSGVQQTESDIYVYIYTHTHTYAFTCVLAQLLQSWLTLCNPMDCSPPGSSVLGILQARILK